MVVVWHGAAATAAAVLRAADRAVDLSFVVADYVWRGRVSARTQAHARDCKARRWIREVQVSGGAPI